MLNSMLARLSAPHLRQFRERFIKSHGNTIASFPV